jgi:hypothetical protein
MKARDGRTGFSPLVMSFLPVEDRLPFSIADILDKN